MRSTPAQVSCTHRRSGRCGSAAMTRGGIADQDVAVRAAGEAVGHVGRRYGRQIGQVRRLDEPQILAREAW